MNPNKKVTVLTTTYNGMPYLEEAIRSTLNQSYDEFNYLIVDDASPDKNVVDCVKSFDDERIQLVVNEKNLGVSRTINKALSMIDSEYVVRMDHDDINLPDRIKDQINFLECNPEISIVCSWEHTIDSNGIRGRDWTRRLDNYGEFLGPIFLGICPIWHPSISFRTKDMVDAGGFRREYVRAEDFEVTARLAVKRYGSAVIPKFHLLQRQHFESQSKEFEAEQQAMSKKIQKEAIQNFLTEEQASDLTSFLSIGKELEEEIDKDLILKNKKILDSLLISSRKKQNMNENEFNSFKKIIFKRVGLGVLFSNYYRLLPNPVFKLLFFILSPLYFKPVYQFLSWVYNSIQYLVSRIRIIKSKVSISG